MSRLWTNDLDALAEALRDTPLQVPRNLAAHLIHRDIVRVLDPSDAQLVERVATAMVHAQGASGYDLSVGELARAAIKAMSQR